jgi:hypothetical protein
MLSWFSYQKLKASEWTRANDALVVAVTILRANVRNNIVFPFYLVEGTNIIK